MMKADKVSQLDIIDRLFLRFSNSLFQDARHPARAKGWAILLVAAFAVLLATAPNLWLSDYFYDVFVPLDGAWRVANGQMPHRDFYTPIGDLYYLMLAIAGELAGMQPKLVIWNNLLMTPFTILAMLQASRGRLPASLSAILIITVGLFSMSPRSIDAISNISYLASYNRHSWALMIPLMILTLIPRRNSDRRRLGDAIVITLLVLSLFYLKATFGVVSIPLLCISMLVPGNRKSSAVALMAISAFFIIFTSASPINRTYLADLIRAGKLATAPQKDTGTLPVGLLKLQSDLIASWFYWLVPLMFAFWIGRSAREEEERREGDRTLLLTLIACGASIGLAWQNHDHSMPALIAAMVIPTSALWRRFQQREKLTGPILPSVPIRPFDPPLSRTSMTLAAVTLCYMCGVYIMEDGWAILSHFFRAATHSGIQAATIPPTLNTIHLLEGPPSTLLKDVIAGKVDPSRYDHDIGDSWPNDAAAILDDAWRLYRAHEPRSPRIATLYFSPIMSYMTLTPPPRHLPAWLDAARTVGPGAPMDPETTFDDTNVIFVPKVLEHKVFLDMIDTYLKKNFSLIGETPIWEMWVRQSQSSGQDG